MTFEISDIFLAKPLDTPLYHGFERLLAEIFDPEAPENMRRRVAMQKNALLLIAHEKGAVLGFKLGFEEDAETYYSWLGGVAPTARKRGIASSLMKAQHGWCCKNGYSFITTRTENRYRDMLLLNIKHGFEISGTFVGKRGELKIMLTKKLLS